MKRIFNSFLNILYPRCCPVCHSILKDQGSLICPRCAGRLRPLRQPFCMKCGKPVEEDRELCRDCERHPHMFDQGRGIFLYAGEIKASLIRYKYYGCREYGDFYAKAMELYAGRELRRWNPGLIVPVPLHKRKQRMRGFNQAAYLARRLGDSMGITVEENLVRKVHSTRSQKKLNAVQRRENLKKAFVVTGRLSGQTVLVIDDVYTTGSTVDAIAELLKENGAGKVCFLTVCIGSQ